MHLFVSNYILDMTILHNNKCSKSRCALNILKEKNINYTVIEYLKDVPSEKEISDILKKLNIPAIDLIRKKEKVFQEKFKAEFTEKEIIKLMHEHPELIERPILINGSKAIIARDEEKIYDFLKN